MTYGAHVSDAGDAGVGVKRAVAGAKDHGAAVVGAHPPLGPPPDPGVATLASKVADLVLIYKGARATAGKHERVNQTVRRGGRRG